MGEPSTSYGVLEHYDPEVIGSETKRLLQRIIWKIEQEKNSLPDITSINDVVSRVARYTGMHENNITKMMVTGNSPTIVNKELLIDRRLVQDHLVSTYLTEKRMPTVTQLFNALQYTLPCYVDTDMFKRILMKMGYVFYKYPEQNTFYVMEKKSVTFQRYKYLKTIQQYRKDNAPIYYIGIASINNSQKILNLERTLQTDKTNIEQHILFTANDDKVEHVKIVASTSYEVLKMWLTSYVLQDLPEESVCVLEDSKMYHRKLIDVPTLHSLKVDMVEWLEDHNIPCDIDMSKSELLKLIETCTNRNENTYAIDNIVETYNHKLLRLPECINGLSIPAVLLSFLNKKNIFKDRHMRMTNSVFSNISESILSVFSETVQKEETRLLEEVMKVDNVLDELVVNTKKMTVNSDDVFLDFNSD